MTACVLPFPPRVQAQRVATKGPVNAGAVTTLADVRAFSKRIHKAEAIRRAALLARARAGIFDHISGGAA